VIDAWNYPVCTSPSDPAAVAKYFTSVLLLCFFYRCLMQTCWTSTDSSSVYDHWPTEQRHCIGLLKISIGCVLLGRCVVLAQMHVTVLKQAVSI
jgi:hypothetical protein